MASAPRPPPTAAIRRESRLACATRSKAAAVLLALACSGALAQDTDARIRALEGRVDELQRRIDVLEDRKPAAAARAECPGWERLRIGMTEPEVRAVIGAPSRIDATPLQLRWRYSCGTAYFDADTRRFVGYELNPQ